MQITGGRWRRGVVAAVREDGISRRHVLVEPVAEKRVKLTNRGKGPFRVNGQALVGTPRRSCPAGERGAGRQDPSPFGGHGNDMHSLPGIVQPPGMDSTIMAAP